MNTAGRVKISVDDDDDDDDDDNNNNNNNNTNSRQTVSKVQRIQCASYEKRRYK
jgi:hypothetical protein